MDDVMDEVKRLIEQHKAATPGSVRQAIIGRKIIEILTRLGFWSA